MSYRDDYLLLGEKFEPKAEFITLKKFRMNILNTPFESFNYDILPGEEHYQCNKHNENFENSYSFDKGISAPHFEELLRIDDSHIKENIFFTYPIFKPFTIKKSKEIIILLHGLNEKSWEKYLPWAHKLVEYTGKTVILFPTAFHMNRAPKKWADPRFMNKVCKERKQFYPKVTNSSLANAAISARLQFLPQRLIWSGLQTYYDILQLIDQIRTGTHPHIHKDAQIDFFSYSVGSFLAEIMLMTNENNYFENSKLCMFCGGPPLNRMSPASKYILDSEANVAIYSFFIEHLEVELKRDRRLAHYFSDLHHIGKYFKSMLDYNKMITFREKRLKKIAKRISALALQKDEIVPSIEVELSLHGHDNKIPIKVKSLDFPYPYDHVIPFPVTEKDEKEIDKCFTKSMKFIAGQLK
ncbi:MAG: DUF6051 family protein [Candidatus Celaenobacter antarcticus]|nr:DUF6051 family protein [Candidatus Celaenobacter antarcticus]